MEKSENGRSIDWFNVPDVAGTKYPVLLHNLVHLEVHFRASGKHLGFVCYCLVKVE